MESVNFSLGYRDDDLVWSESVPVDGIVEIRKSKNGVLSVWYHEDRHVAGGVCIGRYTDPDVAQDRATLFICEDILAPLHMEQDG